MSVHEYRSGSWIALVGDRAVALLHPSVGLGAARELWRLTRDGSRLATWVEHLAAGGIRALPSFAMVEAHPDGLAVLVRGDLAVRVGEESVTGAGYATWREQVLGGGAGFTISAGATGATGATGAAGAAGAVGAAVAGAGVEPAEPGGDLGAADWLPLVGGIALAGALRSVTTSDAHAGLLLAEGESEEDLELTLMQAPALAAALGRGEGTPAAPPAEPPATGAPPAAASSPAAAPPQVEPAGVAGPDDGPDDRYDHLLWSTEQAAEAASEPVAEAASARAGSASAPAESASAPAETASGVSPGTPGDRSLETTYLPEATDGAASAADPPAPAPALPAPALPASAPPAPAATPDRRARPAIISSVPWSTGPREADASVAREDEPSEPGAGGDERRGLTGERPSLERGPSPEDTVLRGELPHLTDPAEETATDAALELVLPSGARVEVTRPVLLGRAPEATRFAGPDAPRLVAVPNPQRDVSGTHVEVRPAGDHVVVTDMSSTNGTVVHVAGQPALRLRPGAGVPVPAGGELELGAEVRVRVARAGETPA
ncbi:FHA domain-containing protein [Georgenia sp. M64]|uniref:FHA domain-containing protein n=1 Tax=Georgenia sp. M64 TaxID=3120520 RepID=UPI0030E0EFD9